LGGITKFLTKKTEPGRRTGSYLHSWLLLQLSHAAKCDS
jgi:hypothetical protein